MVKLFIFFDIYYLCPAYAQPFHTKRNRPSAIAYKRRQPYWLLNWDFAECG